MRKFVATMVLCLIVPGYAAAQQPAVDVFAKPKPNAGKPDPQQQQMGEDVEILRRLLNQTLAKAQERLDLVLTWSETTMSPMDNDKKPNQQSAWIDLGFPAVTGADGRNFKSYFMPDTVNLYDVVKPQAGRALAEAEGIYLKGQGVVYTVTLPAPAQDPRASADKPASPPLSDWERTRKQLRGEKADGDSKNQSASQPSIADVILKLLAENGQHLAGLGDNENITVVVTFRPSSDARADTVTAAVKWLIQRQEPVSPRQAAANDQELLGDLHMKQAKTKEALEAYRAAAEQAPKNEALLRKLAGAYLAEGNYEQAKKHLDQAIELRKKAQEPAPENKPAAAVLPSKLIVTASKKLLDQVGAGKISLAEFKKGATVEYITFPATEKK